MNPRTKCSICNKPDTLEVDPKTGLLSCKVCDQPPQDGIFDLLDKLNQECDKLKRLVDNPVPNLLTRNLMSMQATVTKYCKYGCGRYVIDTDVCEVCIEQTANDETDRI